MSGQPKPNPWRAWVGLLCGLWLAAATWAQDDAGGRAGGPLAEARALALEGKHAEAVSLYRALVADVEMQEGRKAWSLVFLLYEQAVQHHGLGAVEEAEALYRRSLVIAEEHRGGRDPSLVPSLRGLATLAAMRGQLEDAESLYLRALEIQEADDDGQTGAARTLAELGLLHQLQERAEDAEAFYRRALETGEMNDLEETEIAMIAGNLGAIYHQQERDDEAEPLLRRALEIRERLLGPDHPELAEAHEELASLQYRRGRFAEAASSWGRSLRIREQAGRDELGVAEVLGRLAVTYRRMGRAVAADAHFSMAQAILDAQCGGRERAAKCREAIRLHRDLSETPAAPPGEPPPPVSEAPPSPAPPSETLAASPGGRVHRAQVAAREDQREAAEILARLERSHPRLLGGLAARVVSVDLGERGVWHRVQVGEFRELAEAKAFCDDLVERGHEGCWVITDD